MSFLYCSLTGTASNWYDRLPQVYKDDWSISLVNMVDSEDITLEKIKTQEHSLEFNNLSNNFQQNTKLFKILLRNLHKSKQWILIINLNSILKKYCSFCRKKHSVSTCFRRLNMFKESKLQSRSPTPQNFKIPSNKPQYSRYRSRINSNPYRRSSRDTRYRSRSYSRSHSRPRYNDKSHSHNYSPYYNRDRSRYDKHYKQKPHKSYSSSRPCYNSTSSRSPSKFYPRSRERSSSYKN